MSLGLESWMGDVRGFPFRNGKRKRESVRNGKRMRGGDLQNASVWAKG